MTRCAPEIALPCTLLLLLKLLLLDRLPTAVYSRTGLPGDVMSPDIVDGRVTWPRDQGAALIERVRLFVQRARVAASEAAQAGSVAGAVARSSTRGPRRAGLI